MTEFDYPDFASLRVVLEGQTDVGGPAEVHGMLTGMLAGCVVSCEDWLRRLGFEPDGDPSDLLAGEQRELLAQLYRSTVAQLEDQQLGFELLLPVEEESLAVRTEGLAGWCHGFIYGLGISGLPHAWVEGDEVREVVDDLTDIARAVAVDEDTEADEVAYVELTEYVRAGVQLVNTELALLRRRNALH